MLCRPNRLATMLTVPEPPKGSSTVQGIGGPALHVQVGLQLSVDTLVGAHPVLSVLVPQWPGTWAVSRLLTWPVRTISRTYGAPHFGQHPPDDVPARIIGSTSFGGNTAKCAPSNGVVATVHTSRLLRVARIALNASRPPHHFGLAAELAAPL